MSIPNTTGRKEREQISHLIKICHQGKHDQVKEFLSDFPHFLNARDTTDMTMMAPLHATTSQGHYHCVKLLLILNADITVLDMKGRTPFHLSCMEGHFKIAKLLKSKGGSISIQDFGGNTALHLVLRSPTCSYTMVKWLVEAGSDPCTADNYGVTPFNIVEEQHEKCPSSANVALLELLTKYLPVFVADDQIEKDQTIFSMGLGVAIGMILKKEKIKFQRRIAKQERKKQRELEKAEELRNRPEEVRRKMFEHMALMKTRRDFKIKQMKYVFPEESDLSSLPVGRSVTVSEPEVEEKEAPARVKVYDENGRHITKYM